jgi:glycosyltransferase involved in cell wall biosynthesis
MLATARTGAPVHFIKLSQNGDDVPIAAGAPPTDEPITVHRRALAGSRSVAVIRVLDAGFAVRTILALRRRHGLRAIWLHETPFFPGILFFRLGRLLGVRMIYGADDDHVLSHAGPGFRLWRKRRNLLLARTRIAARSDRLVAVTHYLRNLFTDHPHAEVVPVLVDLPSLDAGSAPGPEPRVLYAGSFGAQDELENLIESLALVKARGIGFSVLLLGAAYHPERAAAIATLVERRGLADRVTLVAKASRGEVARYQAEADVLWCVRRDTPWSRSGFPTKLAEGLAAGRAVVTHGFGEVGAYVEAGKNAVVVNPADVREITDALAALLGDADYRRALAAAGRAVAAEHFDVGKSTAKIARILA